MGTLSSALAMHAASLAVDLDDPIVVFGAVAVVAILAGAIRSVLKTQARERSRREIAAYIAEGSMSPDDGERLMRANPDDED